MNPKKIIRSYLSKVSEKLVCPKSLKAAFLSDLRERIQLFQSPDRELTLEVLCEEFGSPEEIAAGFFNREDYEELLNKAKIRVVRWKIICALVVVLLLVLFIFTVLFIHDSAGTIYVSDFY